MDDVGIYMLIYEKDMVSQLTLAIYFNVYNIEYFNSWGRDDEDRNLMTAMMKTAMMTTEI